MQICLHCCKSSFERIDFTLKEIIGVRFRESGKVYSFDPGNFNPGEGEKIIVETSRGIELGIIADTRHTIEDKDIVAPLRRMLRIATPADIKNSEELRDREIKAVALCQEKIESHNLEMKVINAECSFDGSKIIFYFTADGRIDFRNLVKDLAAVFRTRIELRQIGVRDEAKMLGGLGICGRPFCCASFLDDFQPVSIKMAKEQNLSLNQAKISGTCGRLMCCLKYEQEAYEDLIRTTPKVGTEVDTPVGPGTVSDVSLISGKLRIKYESAGEFSFKTFDKCEVCPRHGEHCHKKNKKHEKAPAETAEAE